MKEEDRDELDELLFIHLEEGLSDPQSDRLRELLRADPEARRMFARQLLLDAALHLEQASGLDGAVPELPRIQKRKAPARYAWIGIAATVMFFFGLALGSLRDRGVDGTAVVAESEPTDDGVALLTQSLDVAWEGDQHPVAGLPLSPGRLAFSQGLIQLEFYGGAQLIVEGPADLDLLSVNQVLCRTGKLRVRVPQIARGFTVLSPQFELVDLGTEFGIEIDGGGKTEVQVFAGEVEIYPPGSQRAAHQRQRLFGGSGLSWAASGETTEVAPEPENFPSFDHLEKRSRDVSKIRLEKWRTWSQSLASDSRIVAHFDFEGEGDQLLDLSPSHFHGSIIGSERTRGRWPGKGALEFKKPGDRVRIDVQGEFDALTLAAWIRMDALPGRRQALLLTDRYQLGHVHWQIGPVGELRFGMRVDLPEGVGSGYSSPALFGPRRIGVWNLVCSTYDRKVGTVQNYLNGREVSRHKIVFDQPVKIGQGDIGNWSVPVEKKRKSEPVRNFIGRIDELTIWNTALSEDEILEIHQTTRP